MGKSRDAILGLAVVIAIIVAIATTVITLLPDKQEPQISQSESTTRLTDKEIQTVIAGFESYNKSVKILLDACTAVESESDFVALMQLVNESGDKFLENTANFGEVRNRLIAEGYGDHPELGPLINRSEMLVDQMTVCMELLALEFGQ